MGHFSSMAALPYSRALTMGDLAGLPDDGHRYELVDGSLVVTPAPSGWHQIAVIALLHLFEAAVSEEWRVMVAPYEWRLADDTALQPDVLVVRRDDLGDVHRVAPIVVAEVLSPSTRSFDLLVKRERYDAAGVGAYWVVDVGVPSVKVWARHGASFEVVADVEGDTEAVVSAPFAVRVRPSALLR